MKYLLFAGDDYYPQGGAFDLQGTFDILESAIEGHNPKKYGHDGWANILEIESLKIVKRFARGEWYNEVQVDFIRGE